MACAPVSPTGNHVANVQSAVAVSRPTGDVLELFRLQANLNSVAVLDTNDTPVGIVHRSLLSDALLKPFATDLLARKPISRLMSAGIRMTTA